VTGPVLIAFVDTVFEADHPHQPRRRRRDHLGQAEVEDYQRFGVVVTDAAGYMTRIVEKPSTPVSKLANIGLRNVCATSAPSGPASTTCSPSPPTRASTTSPTHSST
jgi:hypothetical protein